MKLTANLDRKLAPAGRSAERYMSLRVVAPEPAHVQRLPLNLALVLDRSGSMAGTKLDKAKEAAAYCVRNLTASDRLAVVAYDDQVRVIMPSSKLTSEVKARLLSELAAVEPGGSTNLGGGWLTGAQEVANYVHEADYVNRAILLSDGLANVGMVDTGELSHHAAELRQRGVSTTTMGIGADFNEELMEQIAIKGGGHFYFIEDGRQIPDFLHRELGEVLSTVARDVRLEIVLPAGVEASLLNSFEVEHRDGKLLVRLGDLVAGETRSLVFKLASAPNTEGTLLPVAVTLTYHDVEAGREESATSKEAAIRYVPQVDADAETPNVAVVEDAALLEVALAREKALKLDAAGDYAGSAATLRSAAAYIQSVAPASPMAMAEAAALHEESEAAAGGLSGIARKAIHYAQSSQRQSRKK